MVGLKSDSPKKQRDRIWKYFAAILFAIKNNLYNQISGILGVGVSNFR